MKKDDKDADVARAVSDELLDKTRAAYMDRDFKAFAQLFALPLTVGTFRGERVVETLDDLAGIFDAMCDRFEVLGVVDLYRRTLEAEFVDPVTIQATFVSQPVIREEVFGAETVASGYLRCINGRWVVAGTSYASEDAGLTSMLTPGVHVSDRGSLSEDND